MASRVAESLTTFAAHFDGKRFYNPDARQAPGFLDLIRWKLTSRAEASPAFVDDVAPCVPPKRADQGVVRITLVNHSTVLLQHRAFNILTDPIWSERASPLSWIGPRRRRKPGIRQEDLPAIDAVLVSHDHYDHMDLPTLRELSRDTRPVFIVPAGCARAFRALRIAPTQELDWGESLALPNFTIHCVPAVHFSARGILDRNKTLWCAYVIEFQERFIYFAGDTAFGPQFEQVRERFGSPLAALLPIGAYQPRWFMSAVHMSPDEAVRAHDILNPKTSVAIHHGTFQLADEGIETPKKELEACAQDRRFVALKNGEFVNVSL